MGCLLLEDMVLQLFPSFGCLFLFGTFHVCFTGCLISVQLLAAMPPATPVVPSPAIPVPAVNSVKSIVFKFDEMVVGDYPSPDFFVESPATALYHMVPNHSLLLAHVVGIYNALMGCVVVSIPDPWTLNDICTLLVHIMLAICSIIFGLFMRITLIPPLSWTLSTWCILGSQVVSVSTQLCF